MSDIEEQVRKNITDYQSRAKEIFMEPEHEDEPAKIITVHKELDDDTWNLKSVFEEYFPSLQRRSALVTLFSFFEHELDALCKRIQLQENSRLALADMAGKGIHRSTTYLSKVCDIAGILNTPEWQEIKNIQMVRNVIVHADGKFRVPAEASPKVVSYVQNAPKLNGDKEVNLLDGYLEHALRTFDAYFRFLHIGIEHKYQVQSIT